MIRNLLTIMALLVVASLVAPGVYWLSFGLWFDINGTYFPVTRNCYPLFAVGIRCMTWVASFSTISLVYVLIRNRKVNK